MKSYITAIIEILILSIVAINPTTVSASQVISDGSDGAFNPTSNQTIDLSVVAPDGIFNFTTINIPTGVEIKFIRNSLNTPVFFAATEDVIINGRISVSAQNYNGFAGSGGGDGGSTGLTGSPGSGPSPGLGAPPTTSNYKVLGNSGGGGGMATEGLTATQYRGASPALGGIAITRPELISGISGGGGSGGGGGSTGFYAGVELAGGIGGGAGGGLQISTLSNFTLGGELAANGGHAGWSFANAFSYGGPGGGGSGGNIELFADTMILNDTALVDAIGGAGGGLSTQRVSDDPYVYSNLAHGGLGYFDLTANSLFIDPDAIINAQSSVVPIPAALQLFLSGLVGLGLLVSRRKLN